MRFPGYIYIYMSSTENKVLWGREGERGIPLTHRKIKCKVKTKKRTTKAKGFANEQKYSQKSSFNSPMRLPLPSPSTTIAIDSNSMRFMRTVRLMAMRFQAYGRR